MSSKLDLAVIPDPVNWQLTCQLECTVGDSIQHRKYCTRKLQQTWVIGQRKEEGGCATEACSRLGADGAAIA